MAVSDFTRNCEHDYHKHLMHAYYLSSQTCLAKSVNKYNEGHTALMLATRYGNEKVIKMLLKRGRDINQTDKYGCTPFMLAAESGHSGAVKLLFHKGCNVNACNQDGEHALLLIYNGLRGAHCYFSQITMSSVYAEYIKKLNTLVYKQTTKTSREHIAEILIQCGSNVNTVNKVYKQNALMQASSCGCSASVQLLINSGSDINSVNSFQCNALMIAAEHGHLNCVEILVNNGSDKTRRDYEGNDALMIAIKNGNNDIVKMLVSTGWDTHRVNQAGYDALMVASEYNNVGCIEILLSNGCNKTGVDQNGNDALMIACKHGYIDVVELLLDKGWSMHKTNHLGWNAFRVSIGSRMQGRLEYRIKVSKLLLNKGSDVNVVDTMEDDALMHASCVSSPEIVNALISKSSNVNRCNKNGKNALIYATEAKMEENALILLNDGSEINQVDIDGNNALIIGLRNGLKQVVKKLLDKGCCVNQVNKENQTALMLAAANGYVIFVEMLLQKECEVNVIDIFGCNALMLASKGGHEKIVEMLLEAGSEVNIVDSDERSALMLASIVRNLNIVKMLTSTECDAHIVDKDGRNALMLASDNVDQTISKIMLQKTQEEREIFIQTLIFNQLEIVKLLINKGVDINVVDCTGSNALVSASRLGYEKLVEFLLTFDVHVNQTDNLGASSLIHAAFHGLPDMVEMLLNKGSDINKITLMGDNALIIASCEGHYKTVELLLKRGINVNHVGREGWDAVVTALLHDHDNVVELILRNITVVHVRNLYMLEVVMMALEKAKFNVIEKCQEYLNTHKSGIRQRELNIVKKLFAASKWIFQSNRKRAVLKQDFMTEILGLEVQTDNALCGIKRSLNIFLTTTLHNYQHQVPTCEELLGCVSDIMSEYTSMKQFDALNFFVYQKTLHMLYIEFFIKYKDKVTDFFSLLLEHSYPDLTIAHMREEDLLNTVSPNCSITVCHYPLEILIGGTFCSVNFSLKLVNVDALKLFTNYLHSQKGQIHTSYYVTKNIIGILFNMSRKEELKKYFTSTDIKTALLDITFCDDILKLKHWLILEQEKSNDSHLRDLIQKGIGRYENFPLSIFLQAFAKLVRNRLENIEITPVIETLTQIMVFNSIEEKECASECLKELGPGEKYSHEIITNEKLAYNLQRQRSSQTSTISSNINSMFWTAGNATGILPTIPDKVVSGEFPQNFDLEVTSIGRGTFGSVHLVIDLNKPDEKKFVAKRLLLSKLNKLETFSNEASILLKLKHRRVVQFHGYKKDGDDVLIFMEYMRQGTLTSFISKRGNLDEKCTQHFTIQILEAVNYLHENNILHRDIKGNNILMVDESNIKLTDFGLSTIFNEEEGVNAGGGTIQYMAPELITCSEGEILKNATSLDIWSVGCTVVEMLVGKPPQSSLLTPQIAYRTFQGEPLKYQLPESSSADLKEFLNKIFQSDAQLRPTADWLLNNEPFVRVTISDGDV